MIELKNLSLQNGTFKLQDLNLLIPEGNYGALMGKTGCGKTTILEAICGLRTEVLSGQIILHDRDVTNLKTAQRGIGYLPQDGALFTSMTAFENIAWSLRLRKWPKAKINQRVEELAGIMGIEDILQRKPQGLSGGETQRVALARALACYPDVLLLDEPLSALDQGTHSDMCELLKRVQQLTHVTILHITHNRYETEELADVVFRIDNGSIVEATKAGVS